MKRSLLLALLVCSSAIGVGWATSADWAVVPSPNRGAVHSSDGESVSGSRDSTVHIGWPAQPRRARGVSNVITPSQ